MSRMWDGLVKKKQNQKMVMLLTQMCKSTLSGLRLREGVFFPLYST